MFAVAAVRARPEWPAVARGLLPAVVLPFLVLMNDPHDVGEHRNGRIGNLVVFFVIAMASVLAVVSDPAGDPRGEVRRGRAASEMRAKAIDVRGAGGEPHAVRDLRDKRLVDRNHDPLGRAAGVVLYVANGRPPRLACIESGVTVLAARFNHRLARRLRAGSRRWGLRELFESWYGAAVRRTKKTPAPQQRTGDPGFASGVLADALNCPTAHNQAYGAPRIFDRNTSRGGDAVVVVGGLPTTAPAGHR